MVGRINNRRPRSGPRPARITGTITFARHRDRGPSGRIEPQRPGQPAYPASGTRSEYIWWRAELDRFCRGALHDRFSHRRRRGHEYRQRHRRGLPVRPGGHRRVRAGRGRGHHGRARLAAAPAQAHRLGELRLARRAAGHGQLAVGQIRRGHPGQPLLRRLRDGRPGRDPGREPRDRAVRRGPRLRPAALGHRRQPGRVLGHPGPPDRTPGPRPGWCQARQRPGPGRLGRPAPRAARAADDGDVAGRGRSPDPRLPPQHLRQAVRAGQLRGGRADRAARLRRDRDPGPRVPAPGAAGRVLRLSAQPELRHPGRDRGRGRRHVHGGHGALRRAGRGQGPDRRPRPGPARRRGHLDHAQVAARPARRPGAVHRGVRAVRRPGLPDGARRPRCRM